jgi:lysophospholipase L1-like esterase
MRALALLSLLALAAVSHVSAEPPKKIPHDFAKWEKAVAAFEKADAEQAPPKGAVLFVGSSTIVRWKTLAEDLPETLVLNRGFGGNQIADSTYYAERMIFPYEPSMIVLRAGGNDIHAGRSAEEVFGDFKDFVAKVRSKLPEVPIAYLALSPSISRITERAEGDKLNALIAAFVKESKNLSYIDTSKVSLGPDGQPIPDLFVKDNLHFSEAGYKLLTQVVRPFMPKNKAK